MQQKVECMGKRLSTDVSGEAVTLSLSPSLSITNSLSLSVSLSQKAVSRQ